MKLTITSIIMALAFTVAFGQQKDFAQRFAEHKSGDYIDTPELNNFAGTWLWNDGNTSFKLVLIKKERVPTTVRVNDVFYMDQMIGGCLYIKDGRVVINTLNSINDRPQLIGNIEKPNFLSLLIDRTKPAISILETHPRAILQFNKAKRTISWESKYIPDNSDEPAYNLPKDMVLKQVN